MLANMEGGLEGLTKSCLWICLVFSELFLYVSRTEGAAMQYIENSSERHDSYFQYSSQDERWADAAYRYISNLNCTDNLDAFFTTKRECKELVSISRRSMNVYIASGSSTYGYRYKTFLPDEPLSRSESHDAVLAVDPFPLANYGHLVVVFYIDHNVGPSDCFNSDGMNLGEFYHFNILPI